MNRQEKIEIKLNEMEMVHYIKSSDNSKVVDKILLQVENEILRILSLKGLKNHKE